MSITNYRVLDARGNEVNCGPMTAQEIERAQSFGYVVQWSITTDWQDVRAASPEECAR